MFIQNVYTDFVWNAVLHCCWGHFYGTPDCHFSFQIQKMLIKYLLIFNIVNIYVWLMFFITIAFNFVRNIPLQVTLEIRIAYRIMYIVFMGCAKRLINFYAWIALLNLILFLLLLFCSFLNNFDFVCSNYDMIDPVK